METSKEPKWTYFKKYRNGKSILLKQKKLKYFLTKLEPMFFARLCMDIFRRGLLTSLRGIDKPAKMQVLMRKSIKINASQWCWLFTYFLICAFVSFTRELLSKGEGSESKADSLTSWEVSHLLNEKKKFLTLSCLTFGIQTSFVSF